MNKNQMLDRVQNGYDLQSVRSAFNHAFITWRMNQNDIGIQPLVPALEWACSHAEKYAFPVRRGFPLGTITKALKEVA